MVIIHDMDKQEYRKCYKCMSLGCISGVWICDKGNCPITEIFTCTEWEKEFQPPLKISPVEYLGTISD
jgi:hypothetical protein